MQTITTPAPEGNAGAMPPPKPKVLAPRFDNIRACLPELIARPQWVGWRYVWKASAGKWIKLPVQAVGRGAAKSTDPSTWCSFDAACAAHQRSQGTRWAFDGIGFVLDGTPDAQGRTLTGVDFDKVAPAGTVLPPFDAILRELGTYSEWSPSGIGVRAFGLARHVGAGFVGEVGGCGVELYFTDRYLTVTGHGSGAIRDVTAQVANLTAQVGARVREAKTREPSASELVATLGAPPDHMMACAANDDGEFTNRPPLTSRDLALFMDALMHRARRGAMVQEREWKDALWSAAGVVTDHPEHGEQVWEGLDRASNPATNGGFPAGDYDPDRNKAERDRALLEARQRRLAGKSTRNAESLFNEEWDAGWRPPAAPHSALAPAAALAPPSNPFVGAVTVLTTLAAQPFSTAGARRLRPVLGNLLARAVVTLFAAKTKAGKTLLLVGFCLALASGRDLLGLPVLSRPLRVLFINGEEGRDALMLRFRAAMQEHGITEAQVAPYLTVLTADDLGGLHLTRTVGSREELDPAGMAALARLVPGYDVVLLDPLMAFLGSSVNSNEVMAAVMLELNRLARQHDFALLVAHHLRKGAGVDVDGMDAATGASATVNHCRIFFGLVSMEERDAVKLGVLPSDAWRYVAVLELGSNYAPPAAGRLWLEKAGVTVAGTAEPPDYPGDAQAPVMRRARLQGAAGLVTPAVQQEALHAIRRGAAGVPLSDSTRATDRAAVPAIASALAPHLPTLTDVQRQAVAKVVLDDVLARGWVRVDPGARIPRPNGNGSDARRGLVVMWDATPWAASTATTATSPQPDAVNAVDTCGTSLEGHRNVALGGVGDVAVNGVRTVAPADAPAPDLAETIMRDVRRTPRTRRAKQGGSR